MKICVKFIGMTYLYWLMAIKYDVVNIIAVIKQIGYVPAVTISKSFIKKWLLLDKF